MQYLGSKFLLLFERIRFFVFVCTYIVDYIYHKYLPSIHGIKYSCWSIRILYAYTSPCSS